MKRKDVKNYALVIAGTIIGFLCFVMFFLTAIGFTSAKTTPVYSGEFGDIAIVDETFSLRKCSEYVSEGELTIRLQLNDEGFQAYKKILETNKDIIQVDIECNFVLTGDRNSAVKMKEFVGMTADGKYVRKSLEGRPEGKWCDTKQDPEWTLVFKKIREMKGMNFQ